jgi:hypothetical protein
MAFTFKLEQEDGTPADPPVLHTAVPTWQAGDTIPLGRDRILYVIEARPRQRSGRRPGAWSQARLERGDARVTAALSDCASARR